MYLVQLIYASKLNRDNMSEGSVAKIAESSAANNKVKNITGVLYSDGEHFLQTMEGGRTAVSQLFSKISQDKRHENVTILRFQDIFVRDFNDWSMKLLSLTQDKVELMRRYSIGTQFDPYVLAGESSRSFLLELSRFDR